MNKTTFSILWILVTTIIVLMIMLPIHENCGKLFTFYPQNIISIVIAVTFTRYLFLLKYHWFDSYRSIKIVLSFAVIPLILYLVDGHYEFQRFLDEEGVDSLLLTGGNPAVAKYTENEFIFFWAFAMICCIALPIKMIRSIWRDYKSNIK